VLELEDLLARIELKDGPAQIRAPGGSYNFDTSRVTVPGPVDITAAGGYRMLTQNVGIDLKTRRIAGSGGVSGTVPAGTFSAERISGDLGERTVTLEGNARLRMTPGKMRMPQ
jgi:lipopolysaccharide export system protein LptC